MAIWAFLAFLSNCREKGVDVEQRDLIAGILKVGGVPEELGGAKKIKKYSIYRGQKKGLKFKPFLFYRLKKFSNNY